MNTRSLALESLDERDRRIARERMWKVVCEIGEWLLALALAGAVGAVIGFTYGIDYGKAQEVRRVKDQPKPAFNCREVLRTCENQYADILRRRK